MKKLLLMILVLALVLAGCAGTTVVINDCTCSGHSGDTTQPTDPVVREGAVKTGLAVVTDVSGSASANGEENGKIAYDVTMAAVTVDDKGVICSAVIDSVPATLSFDSKGAIVSDLTAEILTKNELGENYGMVAYGGAVAEWDAQVRALCDYAVGKTVSELKNGAIDESGKAPAGSNLASSATIYLAGYVDAIEAAAANARHLGAEAGDKLQLVTLNTLSASTAPVEDKVGNSQLDCSIGVITSKDGVITSCIIDGLQAKIGFDAAGAITSDLTAPILTKNELGESYGMVAWGGAKAEWNEQAAAFAEYVTGKTAAQVAGIAVSEGKPADADLSASVTIAIGDFMALIEKALG